MFQTECPNLNSTISTNVANSSIRADFEIERSLAREDLVTGLKLRKGDKILIFGGYGTSNVGDDAILAGLLSVLPVDVTPTVVSMNPAGTRRIHKVMAVPPVRVPLELLTTNVVIVGGGGMFSAHMGQMSKLLPLMSLAAGLLRKRVSFYGIGAYSSTPGWVRRTLRLALKRARLVTVRDLPSLELLKLMGIRAKQIPDLALMMDDSYTDIVSEASGFDETPDRPKVLLCLTATEPDTGDRILQAIPKVIESMPDVDFLFIPFSHHPIVNNHNDLLLAERLQELSPRMKILREYGHPSRILGEFKVADTAVCMRFHSMVFADRTGMPFVPVSYAPKTDDWLQQRGLKSALIEPNSMVDAIRRSLKLSLRQQAA